MTVPIDDPWGVVDDLDGLAHYKALGLHKYASADDIKKAYRESAKRHHPDKGGSAQAFARVQAAFEVLCDPRKRAVYDEWARELQFRYVPGVTTKAQGGEDVLLNEFEGLGLHCEARTQLVVICEVCRRPSTKECWTCGMKICDFCTLKRHWKGEFALHWPLINSNHMRMRLAKRELEQKRVEDANRLMLQDPNSRSEGELIVIRAFKDAAYKMLDREERQVTYDLSLARFYMWAQTDLRVFIVVFVPTGYADMELVVECSEAALLVQPQNSPPVVDRLFDFSINTSGPIESFRTEDNRLLGLALDKRVQGEHWQRLFRGDPDGARCMLPPYRLAESDADVLLEVDLPFWICPEDVSVRIMPDRLLASVRNELRLCRTYWQNRQEEGRGGTWEAVDLEESMWSLDSGEDVDGEAIRTLMISLVKPPLTETEVTWKRGKRQDNRAKERPGSLEKRGFRFFADDEDEFGLEPMLQALCFREAGRTWVPCKPWEHGTAGSWVHEAEHLPDAAQRHLKQLQKGA